MNSAFWVDRPVLVTGASGLLGGWVVQELVRRHAAVVALVRDGSPRSMLAENGLIDRIVVVHGDLRDSALQRRVMAEYSIDTAFHLAAQPLVGVARLDPIGTLEVNVAGTWTLLDAARQTNVKCVVIASSDKAYGSSAELPYLETHRLQGEYPYDVSKSCADLIASMYAKTYSLPVCIARCANLFGGADLNFSRTIPGCIQSTFRGQRFVIRSDGKFVRDFLYVEDAAEAYLMLAEQLTCDPNLRGEAFNFGLGARLTVLNVVGEILRLMSRPDLEPIIENRVTSEIREQYMCSDKAVRLLGWSPRHDLTAALKKTIEWYRSFLGLNNGATVSTATTESGGLQANQNQIGCEDYELKY